MQSLVLWVFVGLGAVGAFAPTPRIAVQVTRATSVLQKAPLTTSFQHPAVKLAASRQNDLVGEDAAAFNLRDQKLASWAQFTVAVSSVLGVLYYVWLYDGGPQLGDQFKLLMENVAGGDSTLTITYMLLFFAICHSGLASLRPWGEELIGARPWRYVFALTSLPLAFSSIVYFINHRYLCMAIILLLKFK